MTLLMIFNAASFVKLSVHARIYVVLCPAGFALMHKHRLVAMLGFLGPGVRSSQNIGWPVRLKELHNHLKTVKNHKVELVN